MTAVSERAQTVPAITTHDVEDVLFGAAGGVVALVVGSAWGVGVTVMSSRSKGR